MEFKSKRFKLNIEILHKNVIFKLCLLKRTIVATDFEPIDARRAL
jgi:hypothetical protein